MGSDLIYVSSAYCVGPGNEKKRGGSRSQHDEYYRRNEGSVCVSVTGHKKSVLRQLTGVSVSTRRVFFPLEKQEQRLIIRSLTWYIFI